MPGVLIINLRRQIRRGVARTQLDFVMRLLGRKSSSIHSGNRSIASHIEMAMQERFLKPEEVSLPIVAMPGEWAPTPHSGPCRGLPTALHAFQCPNPLVVTVPCNRNIHMNPSRTCTLNGRIAFLHSTRARRGRGWGRKTIYT